MICYNCLVEPICKVGCDKLKDITINQLSLNSKISKRILNSTLVFNKVCHNIKVNCNHGIIIFYKNNKMHRVDGPAVEYVSGTQEWYKNGNLHRIDGPAVEFCSGSKEWWLNGRRHRVDGPAIVWWNGSKEWFKRGLRHRVDGPAVEFIDGTREWWRNGKRIERWVI